MCIRDGVDGRRGPARRGPARGPAATARDTRQPGVLDLHLRFDRPPQGRAGPARGRGQLPGGPRPTAGPRRGRCRRLGGLDLLRRHRPPSTHAPGPGRERGDRPVGGRGRRPAPDGDDARVRRHHAHGHTGHLAPAAGRRMAGRPVPGDLRGRSAPARPGPAAPRQGLHAVERLRSHRGVRRLCHPARGRRTGSGPARRVRADRPATRQPPDLPAGPCRRPGARRHTG